MRVWSGIARIRDRCRHEKPQRRPYTWWMSRKTPAEQAARHTAQPAAEAPTDSPVADFERSLDALEQLVEKMEQGQMSLEDSLAAYERSVGLYRRCQQALEQAELRVRLLTDPEQPDTAEPFGDD